MIIEPYGIFASIGLRWLPWLSKFLSGPLWSLMRTMIRSSQHSPVSHQKSTTAQDPCVESKRSTSAKGEEYHTRCALLDLAPRRDPKIQTPADEGCTPSSGREKRSTGTDVPWSNPILSIGSYSRMTSSVQTILTSSRPLSAGGLTSLQPISNSYCSY
jgi:hypothetical protein